jgi:photosystem II stability/assembly factor-like uncharacterized protein
MADWQQVELSSADTAEDIARKLIQAMAAVHERLGPVMIWYRGQPYVAIVPPDAGQAWQRAEESQRLSRIATVAAGLDPGSTLRLTDEGQVVVEPAGEPGQAPS